MVQGLLIERFIGRSRGRSCRRSDDLLCLRRLFPPLPTDLGSESLFFLTRVWLSVSAFSAFGECGSKSRRTCEPTS